MSGTTGTILLDRCPACAYALCGLPTKHRCPECGLALDRRWAVFGGVAGEPVSARRDARAVRFMMLAGAVLGVPSLVLMGTFLTTGLGRIVVFCLTAGIVVWGRILYLHPQVALGHRFVAVGPDGIVLFHGAPPLEYFDWGSVTGTRLTVRHGQLIIKANGRSYPTGIGRNQNGRHSAKACHRYIQDSLKQRSS